LPLSHRTRGKLVELTKIHDGALDWADPGGPSPWSKVDFDEFEAEALAILEVIQAELGDDFLVWYQPIGEWQDL